MIHPIPTLMVSLNNRFSKLNSLQFSDLEQFINLAKDFEADDIQLTKEYKIPFKYSIYLKNAHSMQHKTNLFYKYIKLKDLKTYPGYNDKLEPHHGLLLELVRRLDPQIKLTNKQVSSLINAFPEKHFSLKDEVILTLQDIYGEDYYLKELSGSGKYIMQTRKALFQKKGITSKILVSLHNTKRLEDVSWLDSGGLKKYMESKDLTYTEEDQNRLNVFIKYVPEDFIIESSFRALVSLGHITNGTMKEAVKRAQSGDEKLRQKLIEYSTYRLVNMLPQHFIDGKQSKKYTDMVSRRLRLISKNVYPLIELLSFMSKKSFIHVEYIASQFYQSEGAHNNITVGYWTQFFTNPHNLEYNYAPVIGNKLSLTDSFDNIFKFKDFFNNKSINYHTVQLFVEKNFEKFSERQKKYIIKKSGHKLKPETLKKLQVSLPKYRTPQDKIEIELNKMTKDFTKKITMKNYLNILNKIKELPRSLREDSVVNFFKTVRHTYSKYEGKYYATISTMLETSIEGVRSSSYSIENKQKYIRFLQ